MWLVLSFSLWMLCRYNIIIITFFIIWINTSKRSLIEESRSSRALGVICNFDAEWDQSPKDDKSVAIVNCISRNLGHGRIWSGIWLQDIVWKLTIYSYDSSNWWGFTLYFKNAPYQIYAYASPLWLSGGHPYCLQYNISWEN